MRKILFFVLLGVPFMLQIESCGNAPFACYRTNPDESNLKVGQPITFSASCSTQGDGYFWEFYGNEDSTYFGYSVTQTFYDTGYVDVFLLVSKGKKSNSTRSKVYIKP